MVDIHAVYLIDGIPMRLDTEANVSYTEVTLTSNDKLQRHIWRYRYNDNHNTLTCQFYAHQNRETRRHKFRNVDHWDRFNRRSDSNTLSVPRVEEGVEKHAKIAFMNTVKVKTGD